MSRDISQKIVMLGHFGVGKTSLTQRFVDHTFNANYLVTLGVQVKKRTICIEGTDVSLIIWDIEGKEDLTQVRTSYLLGVHGIVYVYDLVRYRQYDTITPAISYLNKHYPTVPVVLCGNKADLLPVYQRDKLDITYQNVVGHFHTSAKTNENVERSFLCVSRAILKGIRLSQG